MGCEEKTPGTVFIGGVAVIPSRDNMAGMATDRGAFQFRGEKRHDRVGKLAN